MRTPCRLSTSKTSLTRHLVKRGHGLASELVQELLESDSCTDKACLRHSLQRRDPALVKSRTHPPCQNEIENFACSILKDGCESHDPTVRLTAADGSFHQEPQAARMAPVPSCILGHFENELDSHATPSDLRATRRWGPKAKR